MDMVRLNYFITIVDEGSISRAASKLNMTQPPLSMALKKFEEELGFSLFSRKGRQLAITSAGKIIYERGKELIFSSNAIIKEATEQNEGKTGSLTIGCSTIANLTIIPLVMERMKEKNINIKVKVLEGNTAFILEQLQSHHMDIGFVRNVFNKTEFDTQTLLYEPLSIALPPDHALSKNQSISLIELKDDNFLMPYTTLGYGISEFIIEGCESLGFQPNIIYQGTETLPMLDMVKRGLGVAFVPALFKQINGFELPKLLKLTDPEIRASLNLATLKSNVQKSATEKFLSITKEVIEDYAIV